MDRQELELKVAAKLEMRRRLNNSKTVYGIYNDSGLMYCLQEQNGEYVKVDSTPVVSIPVKLERFLTTPKRFKIAFGGRGAGKSYTFADIFLSQVKDYGKKILCLREYQNSIKDSSQAMLKSAADRLCYDGFNPMQDSIRYKDVDAFRFKGLARDPDGVKSAFGFDVAFVEEAQSISEKSIEMLTPTIRKEKSEIWIAMNPRHSTDPVAQRFLKPFYRQLLTDGFYEDDLHLIVWINYNDNPWHSTELEKERLFAEQTLTRSQYNYIWLGHYNDEADDPLIKRDWFDAAIDAHEKLNIKVGGHRVVAHDPSDVGNDDKALCEINGILVENVLAKADGDACDGADWATLEAKRFNADTFVWDCDGLGVSLKREVERGLSGTNITPDMFKGSNGAENPLSDYAALGSSKRAKNKDTFKNKRAQYYIRLRDRFFKTYRAVVKGEYHDPDELISIKSDIKLLDALRSEVCAIELEPNGAGKLQILSKEKMRKTGMKSPNLADSLMMTQINRKDDVVDIDLNFDSLWE